MVLSSPRLILCAMCARAEECRMFKKMKWGGAALCATVGFAFAAFSAPMPASAAVVQHDLGSIKDHIVLTEEVGGCPGHLITGSTEKYQIEIKSGVHDVTLRNASLDEGYWIGGGESGRAAIAVREGAVLNLTLEGQNSLSAYTGLASANGRAGICVEPGASLVIDGTGSLRAEGESGAGAFGAAGIGGNYNQASGDITIKNGDITAIASGGGAGIGGGYNVGGASGYGATRGNITIVGGRVVAQGGRSGASTGAGIGAGENGDYGGTITISGGLVYAIGGSSSMASIGGGGNASGEGGDNGTFTTGEHGSAIIVASDGIGDRSGIANWSGIFVSSEGSIGDVVYDFETGNVTFAKNVAYVYGEPAVDYNITVDSSAALRLLSAESGGKPAVLRMGRGTTLTNNNADGEQPGITLEVGTKLVLVDGIEQCNGNGFMQAVPPKQGQARGVVQLPVTAGLVGISPESYVYDGTAKEPTVNVQFKKWSFTQDFTKGVDYALEYADNINVGEADATVTSAGKGNLLSSTYTGHFQITQADFAMNMPLSWTVKKGEAQLLDKLPKARFAAGTPDVVKAGELTWFVDDKMTTQLGNDAVENKDADESVTVYWSYVQSGDIVNYPTAKTGSMTLVVSQLEPANVGIEIDGSTTGLEVVYGSASKRAEVKLTDSKGASVELQSKVTWASSDEDVATVDDDGAITFTGVGTATLTASVAEHPAGEDDGYAATTGSVTVKVTPKPIKVDTDKTKVVPRAFDGTKTVEVTAELEADSIVHGDEGKVVLAAAGELDGPNAEKDKHVHITYQLTGERAKHYTLTPATGDATVTIGKADPSDFGVTAKTGELTIKNGRAATYEFNLTRVRPTGNLPIVDVEFTVKSLHLSDNAYFDKSDISIDNDDETMRVKVNRVDSTDTSDLGTITLTLTTLNYEDITTTITVKRENTSEPEPVETFTITASAGEGGSISPSGEVEVAKGNTAVFTITPDNGFKVKAVVVDGAEAELAGGGYVFENVEGDHTIAVSFEKDSTESVDPDPEPVDPADPSNPADPDAGDGDGGDAGDDGDRAGDAGDGADETGGLPATGDPAAAMTAIASVAGILVGIGAVGRRRR